MGTVIIMRGVPGSGKSTLAKTFNGAICSADDFFVGDDGVYRFDPRDISSAHAECFSSFVNALKMECETVIVDNTNIELWEMSPYIALAKHFEFDVRIIRADCDPEIAASRNVHGVPKGAIMSMHSRMAKILPFWPKEEVVKTDP